VLREANVRNPILLAAAVLAALSGCYMEVPSEVVEGRVVATRRDPGADFGAFATFRINPSWTVYDDDNPDGVPVALPTQIEARIRQNLEDRGYVEDLVNPPDLGVQVTAIIGQIDVWYPGYWCDPYWGYCYGWGTSYSYQVGTMVMELIDLADATPGGDAAILWDATSYGVLFGPPIEYDLPNLLESVDRAFAQSPYIQAAP
jgi:hypothetical protein